MSVLWPSSVSLSSPGRHRTLNGFGLFTYAYLAPISARSTVTKGFFPIKKTGVQ